MANRFDTGLEVPPSSILVLIVIFLVFEINMLLSVIDINNNAIIMTGLLLDILGAMILVIPDIPRFRIGFLYYGNLKFGLKKLKIGMGTDSLYRPEIAEERGFTWRDTCGFWEILDVIRRFELSFPPSAPDRNWENIYRLTREKRDEDGTEVKYIVGYCKDKSDGEKVELEVIESVIEPHFEDEITLRAANIRRFGIYLIIVGFAQQIYGLSLYQPLAKLIF